MLLLERKRDVWENSVLMVFLGHQGLVWDRGVSPLLGWDRTNMAGVFSGVLRFLGWRDPRARNTLVSTLLFELHLPCTR